MITISSFWICGALYSIYWKPVKHTRACYSSPFDTMINLFVAGCAFFLFYIWLSFTVSFSKTTDKCFCAASNLSIVSENDVLRSIGAFAFASLPQLTDMWVWGCPKATARDVFYRAAVFSLCFGTGTAAASEEKKKKDLHPNKWVETKETKYVNSWLNECEESHSWCHLPHLYIHVSP